MLADVKLSTHFQTEKATLNNFYEAELFSMIQNGQEIILKFSA